MMDTRGGNNAKAMVSAIDRISGLPDELLHHIMSFLPAEDVVRTCVLSPRWRYLWATAGSFKFDAQGFTSQKNFIDFVRNLLIRRVQSSVLESCSIRAAGPDIFLSRFEKAANIWIGYALCDCKVQTLSIINENDPTGPVAFEPWHRPFISPYLKRLHLCYVNIECPFLRNLMSACSALEDLEMRNCVMSATEFSSATLKNLTIDYDYDFPELSDYEDFHDIVINMPSLVSLRIGPLHGPKPIFAEVQSLVTASISMGCFQSVTFAEACDILSVLSKVKNLELLFVDDVDGECSLQSDMQLCQTVFTNLTTLSLSSWCLHDDCEVLLHMLRRSPNLKILTLKLKHWFPWGDGGMKDPYEQTTKPFHCEKLKKIEIICPKRTKRVGLLVTILFANIISPPEIKIKPLPGYSMYEFSWQRYDFN